MSSFIKCSPCKILRKYSVGGISLAFASIQVATVEASAKSDFFYANDFATAIMYTNQNKGGVIRGVVKDENGDPILGANVFLIGANVGAVTNSEGKYSLNTPEIMGALRVSYIGYVTQTISINPKMSVYDVTLLPDVQRLNDVVVTGYQTISRERAAGSFSVVSGEDIKGRLQSNIMDRLEGKIAGLAATQKGLRIRGQSTLNGNTQVLYVVDGVPFEGDIQLINPADIVNVTVLKDASAASIYGARSANGVVVITTRAGEIGKTRVSYNGSVKFTSLPSRRYMNRMNSRELVDFQSDLWGRYTDRGNFNDREYYNPVFYALFQHSKGLLTSNDLANSLEFYKNRDRYDELERNFLRKSAVFQQHSIALSGGAEKYKFFVSVNYTDDKAYNKNVKRNDRLGFNLRNQFQFFSWLTADLGILGSKQSMYNNTGLDTYDLYIKGPASYYTLRNPDGSPAQWYKQRSQREIDRLNTIGLLDETFVPVNEAETGYTENLQRFLNVNIGLNLKLLKELTLDLRYQNENGNVFHKDFQSKDHIYMKTLINSATVVNNDGTLKRYIPLGGMVTEVNAWNNAYTFRAQANFQKALTDKHDLKVIAGAERRAVRNRTNGVLKLGYDDDNLGFKLLNELDLSQTIRNTEALYRVFSFTPPFPKFEDHEDRYISFYGNAAYSFGSRVSLTASIRMDQSNLFGTNPKDQYRPLWSVGGQYVVFNDKYPWLNRLAVRATYGINGNIAKKSGPFMIIEDGRTPNYYTNEIYSSIISPPNRALRWEKTKTTNLGIDFNLLDNRISGSVDVYTKQSSDLLGNMRSDPTLGWNSVQINYGSMYNRGGEVVLQSMNIQNKSFSWLTNFVFAYNKNKIINVDNRGTGADLYYSTAQVRAGYPFGALFSVKYAGLDEKGQPRAFDKDGNIVDNSTKLTKDDLVYSGVSIAPANASLTNTFRYRGFELSFLVTYYGGHKMRVPRAGAFLDKYPVLTYITNPDKEYLSFWKNPGDESDLNIAPAFNYPQNRNIGDLWKAADIHVKRADYIKLRDLTLSYHLPAALLQKVFVRQASINVQCLNLWTWAAAGKNLDSEVWSGTTLSPSRGIQIPRSYTIGLSLNF